MNLRAIGENPAAADAAGLNVNRYRYLSTIIGCAIAALSGLFYFMDNATYEQIELGASDVGDTLKFVKENETVKVLMHNGKVFGIEPPLFVELEITEAEPGVKGNTATGATKPAFVETGAKVMVPLFIEQGERIKIDTRTGEYLSRA